MRRLDLREHFPSILVATISTAFGVALLRIVEVIAAANRADSVTGESDTVALLLSIVAVVFLVVAMYVAAIVTANTFATIVAGRTRGIALLRLLGASATTLRRRVAGEGLGVGIVGAVVGAVLGLAAAAGLAWLAVVLGYLPDLDYGFISGSVAPPAVAVALTTWLASWIGSRRVLHVTPLQALANATERSSAEAAGRTGRNVVGLVLLILGVILLALGIVVGLLTPLAVFLGLIGGILSFTGLVSLAQVIMPPALRLVGRLLGGSAPSRLAAQNALRYPERSSRTTIGLVIGVTLITMFGVGIASFEQLVRLAEANQPGVYAGIDTMLTATVVVLTILVGFSALIAAVGLVNNLSLSVLQRTRELGLLRALGFTAGQIRRMILAESAQLTFAAVLVGLLLGGIYGWVGAQSLLGAINGAPGIVLPGVPWTLLGGIAIGSGLLTWVASVAPARRATRVAPVTALSVE